uniref:Uncharacterized protein n=1 Tax=Romanomermis culicivorax TaxID=13658 RepID=A0A915JDK9_ROMCU
MALLIGLNFYQAVKTVENIEKFVTLNDRELLDESLRATFHLDPAANIQELISEERANEFLKEQGMDFLMRNKDQFDVLIRKSAWSGAYESQAGLGFQNSSLMYVFPTPTFT